VNHRTARGADHRWYEGSHYHNSLWGTIGKTNTFYSLTDFQSVFSRAEIENQDLVLAVVDTLLK